MLRRATPDDFELVRTTRLGALRLAPSAYGSSYERERAFADDVWIARLQPDANPTFLWHDEAGTHGMVVGAPCPHGPDDARLYAMWVRPESRGSGVADALVEAVIAWAVARRSPALRLHVTDGNTAAERLYARHGFVPSGSREWRERDELAEIEYELRLTR